MRFVMFAIGAAGSNSSDANLRDCQDQPSAITVSALGSDGRYSNYSNYGADVFVTVPSNSASLCSITTTDRTTEADGYNRAGESFPDPDCTTELGGTSSATPLVAGALALAKQAKAALDTRFAKHRLARTSDMVDAADSTPESDGGWRTNAAGFHFNQRYGFGLIDADQLTQQAAVYDGVTTLVTQSTGTTAINQTLANTGSRTVQFDLSAGQSLEEVRVTVDFETPDAYPVEVNLTTPSGYRTRLMKTTSARSSHARSGLVCHGRPVVRTVTLTTIWMNLCPLSAECRNCEETSHLGFPDDQRGLCFRSG